MVNPWVCWKIETLTSGIILSNTFWVNEYIGVIHPVLSTIALVTGVVLGIHGVYLLWRDGWNSRL